MSTGPGNLRSRKDSRLKEEGLLGFGAEGGGGHGGGDDVMGGGRFHGPDLGTGGGGKGGYRGG